MREIAILGIGQTVIAEQWDKSLRELAGEAVLAALADARRERVDGLFVGNMLSGPLNRQENLGALSAGVWLMIALIIIFPTVGAYYLNAWALTKVPPSTVAVYIYLQPLVAFGFAPLLLGEAFNSRTIIAALLIFAGVAVVTKRGHSRAIREISEHPDALAH